jgi:magnesium-transporting ATPase (P-type)
MRTSADEMLAEADKKFEIAEELNGRGDELQKVMLITAIGLAFAVWASLLKEESNMRLLFALMALITTVIGVITYLDVPTIAL